MIEGIDGAAALIVVADEKGREKTYTSKRFAQYVWKSR